MLKKWMSLSLIIAMLTMTQPGVGARVYADPPPPPSPPPPSPPPPSPPPPPQK